jgi:uncharacterized membrane protein YgaE (UPF0421/DUF939 family)
MEDKKLIAKILREGLEPVKVDTDSEVLNERLRSSVKDLLSEAKSKKKDDKKKDKKKDKDKESSTYRKWYKDVERTFFTQDDSSAKRSKVQYRQVDFVRALNPSYENSSEDEKSSMRSEFSQKLRQYVADAGDGRKVERHFTEEELGDIRKLMQKPG